jgi:hypothetical protein
VKLHPITPADFLHIKVKKGALAKRIKVVSGWIDPS